MMTDEVPDIDCNEKINKDLSKLTVPWRLPNPKTFAFVNGSIIDSLNGKVLTGLAVLTKDGSIEEIIPNSDADGLDTSVYIRVDCSGKFLCPGLFDYHIHALSAPGESDLRRLMRLPKAIAHMRVGKSIAMMLKRGFTSVRDCGGAENNISQAIDQGVIHGPRMFRCGHAISQTAGHSDMRENDMAAESFDSCECHIASLGVIADGVTECMKVTREEFRRGASFIKIMGSGGVASPTDNLTNLQYTDEEIQAIVKVADSYDSFVTAHAYTPRAIMHCINNGCRGIEHGNLINDEAAKLMADKGAYLTPTLVTYKVMGSDQFSHFLTPDSMDKNKMILKGGLQSLLIAKRNNVKICYGSDLLGSLNGYQTGEFFLRGKVLSPAEILLSATVTPAEALGLVNVIGQIKKGFYADILLLNNNPLEDIGVLDEPEANLMLVMKDGIIFDSKLSDIPADVEEICSV